MAKRLAESSGEDFWTVLQAVADAVETVATRSDELLAWQSEFGNDVF